MTEMGASRRSILIELRRHDEMTIDDLVLATGLSKTATRAHLIRMERDDVVARVTCQPEGPGRPPVAFCLTDRGALMLPSEDGQLLFALLRFLEKQGAGELVSAFFTEMWAERMSELLEVLGTQDLSSADLAARLSAIEEVLAKGHFMPVINRGMGSDGAQIVSVKECNCPFPAAVRASRVPCKLEIDFLSRALGKRPISTSIATDPKGTCTFEFTL